VDAVVVRRCDFVAAPFRRDIRALLAGQQNQEAGPADERWIVCAKNPQGELKTVQLPALGKAVLEMTGEPRRVGDLFDAIPRQDAARREDANPFLDAGVHLVQQLISQDLIEEVIVQ
jgi:hypothetical protein